MDLPEKLTNVRRATRLLAAYNRRLISILSLVNQALESTPKLGICFVRWDPIHHKAIGQQRTAIFGRWGWDYVPLSYSWFQWSTDGEDRPKQAGAVFVAVQHDIDAYQKPVDGTEPDPTTFGPEEAQVSRLRVWITALVSGSSGDTWSRIDEVIEGAFDDAQQWDAARWEVPTAALSATPAGSVIRYVGWEVQMDTIASEHDVDTLLLTPLRQHLADIMK